MGKVAVIGAGTMGNGIAQTFAANGFEVALIDQKTEFVQGGVATIQGSLARFVKKGTLTEADAQAIAKRITPTTSYDSVKDIDLAVEAVFEDAAVKKDIFRKLDETAPARAILASNTSSISITEIAAATKRPAKVIGMHFMNPVPIMKLVEIIRGKQTSDETCIAIRTLTEKLGKVPVEANDAPGFVSNRILMPMLNEAFFTLQEGVSTREGIDTVMKLGMNHPMGPLELADVIGLDVCLNILRVLHEGFRDDKYRPCPLLEKMVAEGRLGRKTGKGFYEYPSK